MSLLHAAATGDIKELERLIAQGCPNCSNEGRVGLFGPRGCGFFARNCPLCDGASRLLELKGPGGYTAMLWAAAFGRRDCVRELLRAGASLEATTDLGDSALVISSERGYVDVVRLLLDQNAGSRNLALMRAALMGQAPCASELLAARASAYARTDTGDTALSLAVSQGFREVVAVLIAAGVDPQDRDGAFVQAAACGKIGCVPPLLKAGADVDSCIDNGSTALMLAAEGGHQNVVALLVEAAADVHAKDCNGETAMTCATNKGHRGIISLLRVAGNLR